MSDFIFACFLLTNGTLGSIVEFCVGGGVCV